MTDPKIIFSHPTGNANVRAALNGLFESNLLESFFTTIACFQGNAFDKLSRINALKEFNRRRFDEKLKPLTKSFPYRELARLLAAKTGMNSLVKHETGIFSVDAIYHALDRKVAEELRRSSNTKVGGVYAYEDGAVNSFRIAKNKGINCLYDLPIGYWRSARKLMAIENERWPQWSSTLTGFKDSEIKLAQKDEELSLANRIYVASSFTAKSLGEFPDKLAPVTIVPYGFPETGESREYTSAGNRKLKLLFVGGLSQRKGIADLFAAIEPLDKYIELTVVGQKASNDCAALDAALKKHKWIPGMSHDNILKTMRENDILVFPSLFEGFGLVITEAMSQGTPVITTDRTAGPDLIQHGYNGWIIEAGSAVAIETILSEILKNPDVIAKVGNAAMEAARKRSWGNYGKDLANALMNKN